MSTVSLTKINNVTIQLVNDKNQRLVPIRPICDALCLPHQPQRAKIKKDEFLSSVVTLSRAVGADKKRYKMVCLPLQYIFGWLFTINPKNVNKDAKEFVKRYRIECYNALYHYFAAQEEFLTMKQELINKNLEKYVSIQQNFRDNEKRLKEAKAELYKAKDFTFEEWAFQKRQMSLDFVEGNDHITIENE